MHDGVMGEWMRVVASMARLRLLALLANGAELPHKELAEALGCTPSALSIDLRLLLRFDLVRRELRQQRVYWIASPPDECPDSQLAMLNNWLHEALVQAESDTEAEAQLHAIIFAAVTIFTCPRRTHLLRLLQANGGSMPLSQLRAQLHMGYTTLVHHLDKLERRGLVTLHRPAGERENCCMLCLNFRSPLHRSLFCRIIGGKETPREPAPTITTAPSNMDHLPATSSFVRDVPFPLRE